MKKTLKLLIPVMALALIIAGCSTETPMDSKFDMNQLASNISIPPGATLQSASFNVYVGVPSGQHVNAHRITDMWDESTVTWNSFDSAFDASPEAGFVADAEEWVSLDVTSLVGSWIDGTYPNYGIMLDQDDLEWPRTLYMAKEFTEFHAPAFLEVCYMMDGMAMCDTTEVIGDSYILENVPDNNYGSVPFVYTGRYAEGEPQKWALFQFELTVEPPELCAIGDYVWHDLNMDGIQDEGEPGVPGVTVHLMDCDGNILDETTTDANGFYLFDELECGDYNIHFVLPDGYVWTLQDQGGDDALDSDADMNGFTICTNLADGETDLTWDAGIYRPTQEGCTRTPGYWGNWTGLGPQPDKVSQYLPIWLGDPGGDESVAVTDVHMVVDIFDYAYDNADNGILRLYRHLLAAKLNIAAGASDGDLGTAVADADAFLAMHSWTDWDSLSEMDREMVNDWKDMFDEYNNGDIGPGSCDDLEDEEEEEDDD